MRKIIFWIVNLAVFALLFIFSLKNLDNIIVRFVGVQWEMPMIVLILLVFALGCFVGLFAMLPFIWGQRRKNKKAVQQVQQEASALVKAEQNKIG